MQAPVSTNNIEVLRTAKESHYFDRKSARIKVRDLAKTVIAFANAAGGKLVVGIEDDGTVTGFGYDTARDIKEFEQVPIFECTPSPVVECTHVPITKEGDNADVVLVLDVEPSTDAVIRRKGDDAVFLRQGDKSPQLNDRQIRALEYDKNQRLFEDEVSPRATIEDIDHEVLDRYKRVLGTASSDEQVLRSRDFLIDGHLTNAGILLFAENPTRYLPQARVRVLRYEGTQMETGKSFNVVKDEVFDGPIPKAVDGAASLIRGMLREFQFLGKDGRFQVIPEYPEFAWFEGLVNAVTHRDYAFAGDHIRVSMYDDRLEIKSPGKLPNIVTLDNMRETRYSRNPKIARTLVEFGWVKELNEGVKRIYTEMQGMFLNDPIFSEPNGTSVQMALENSITSRILRHQDTLEERIPPEVMATLSEYEVEAVQIVLARGKVTSVELGEVIERNRRTATRVLRGLQDKGILRWHGSATNDPAQYYSFD